jgi:hypothetical protein
VTRDELEHAIRAACDVAGDEAVYVVGSQAILGQYPDAPPALRMSMEADVVPVSRADRVDAIDGALGELSQFQATHGFYVHGLTLDSLKLPSGWKKRVIEVRDPVGTSGKRGLCLEAHDLAAAKLAAFRDKDRDFVRVLLIERLVAAPTLRKRIGALPVGEEERARRVQWVKLTFSDRSTDRGPTA